MLADLLCLIPQNIVFEAKVLVQLFKMVYIQTSTFPLADFQNNFSNKRGMAQS